MKKHNSIQLLLWGLFILGGVSVLGLGFTKVSPVKGIVDGETYLHDVMTRLGDAPLPHQVRTDIPGVSAERGEQLVRYGITTDAKGNKTGKQSPHFVCTSCHNIQRDQPDLSRVDPQGRLTYSVAQGLPFLPGSALYGAVNRTSFYNDDYQKKYGDLVIPAKNNLREAIQLCAVECSQGRKLEDWELESVLAYLYTIGLKMKDLPLKPADYEVVNLGVSSQDEASKAVQLLKSKYLLGEPATFLLPPPNRKTGTEGMVGNAENGRLIYENACLFCHENQRYAFYNLDNSKKTLDFLNKHAPKYTRYSIYQVIRYGTSPIPGKRTYMPNYTAEKMSLQQVEDLRAYLKRKERKKQ